MLSAQSRITGLIKSSDGKAISNAYISSPTSLQKSQSDSAGYFEIALAQKENLLLLITHPEYKPSEIKLDTSVFYTIILSPIQNIDGAKVSTSSQRQTSLIGAHTMKTEIITSGELKKAACCDLAGCFETQGTVAGEIARHRLAFVGPQPYRDSPFP
jgi:hypothetical protein